MEGKDGNLTLEMSGVHKRKAKRTAHELCTFIDEVVSCGGGVISSHTTIPVPWRQTIKQTVVKGSSRVLMLCGGYTGGRGDARISTW